ncbi:MAG TPA: hypothetical protein PKC43_09490 [Phycisphaerales bacterium]|nr:hypothetical protein [Phycisphaerales bacterium]HMP37667.1 hypothetical protein [Phycisphaerales bacterium]
MDCQTCGYALWNLAARTCPECGTAFRPSEFDFAPGSVRFCCPSCDQAYYGTDARGQLVPRAFRCVRCGEAVDADSTVVRPLEGDATGVVSSSTLMPWLRRAELGRTKAWFMTLGQALAAPATLVRGVPVRDSAWSALGFMCMTLLTYALAMLGPVLLLHFVGFGNVPGMATSGVIGGLLLLVLATFAGGVALGLLWLLIAHTIMRLIGGTQHPLRRTAHAICYSSLAALPAAIPCFYCTAVPGVLWWIVSGATMCAAANPGRSARAAAAAVLGAILVFGGTAGSAVAFVAHSINRMARQARPTMPHIPASSVHRTATAIADHRRLHGSWPRHGLELLSAGLPSPVQMDDLVSAMGMLAADRRFSDGTGLAELLAAPGRAPAVAAAAAAAQPADIAVHRVGDWLFMWHGVPADSTTPGLWVAMVLPVVPFGHGVPIQVIGADGVVENIPGLSLAMRIEQQNALRRQLGVPELPTQLLSVVESSPR